MRLAMRRHKKMLLRLADVFLAPLVLPAALLMKFVRRAGVINLPMARKILLGVGVFPIRDHYYEPQFDHRNLATPPDGDRPLPGIGWNVAVQLELLSRFRSTDELSGLPEASDPDIRLSLFNGMFEGIDAVYYYNLIRLVKPAKIIEIGSGYSTLVALAAIRANQAEDGRYSCDLRCIEPYEAPWLEKTGATVIRQKAETLGASFFSGLGENDILFIDSSHVIKPQGDVLFAYLQLLPSLHEGVIVHAHDIFSPRDYPKEWLIDEVYFWNEQYLLEAFLTNNNDWKVIGSLNWLFRHHGEALAQKCHLAQAAREPRSFYIQKIRA
jgi:Methyltransferase domain